MEWPQKYIIFFSPPDNFQFGTCLKLTYLTLTVAIIVCGLLIHQRILIFLSKQTGRCVDQMIRIQVKLNVILFPLSLAYLTGLQWTNCLKDYISYQGCYILTFLANFQINYIQCHSFAIAMFRYICILHPDKISRLGQNSPQVSTLHVLWQTAL